MRKAIYGITLVLLFSSILPSALIIRPVKAEWTGTVYIRADGSVDPPDAPIITYDKVTYMLTDNITCFGNDATPFGMIVERDNIVIDGNGYIIQGRAHISFFDKGINISNRRNVTIRNLKIQYFWVGIFIYNSSYIRISKNIISCRASGIVIDTSFYNSISGNNITDNWYGIDLYNSSYNTISENDITYNYCGFSLRNSYNNKIYHNNFIGNKQQVRSWAIQDYDPFINIWDDGYPSGGNFWSNYTGVDHLAGPNQDQPGSDGIGDTPYTIDAFNMDHYPLTSSYRRSVVAALWTRNDIGLNSNPESIAASLQGGVVTFSPDGKYFALNTGTQVLLFRTDSPQVISRFDASGNIFQVKLSKGAEKILIASITREFVGYYQLFSFDGVHAEKIWNGTVSLQGSLPATVKTFNPAEISEDGRCAAFYFGTNKVRLIFTDTLESLDVDADRTCALLRLSSSGDWLVIVQAEVENGRFKIKTINTKERKIHSIADVADFYAFIDLKVLNNGTVLCILGNISPCAYYVGKLNPDANIIKILFSRSASVKLSSSLIVWPWALYDDKVAFLHYSSRKDENVWSFLDLSNNTLWEHPTILASGGTIINSERSGLVAFNYFTGEAKDFSSVCSFIELICNGSLLWCSVFGAEVALAKFSPDGRFVVIAGTKGIRVYPAVTSFYFLRISKVLLPSRVNPNQEFCLSVTISYAFPSQTDVELAVWSPRTEESLSVVRDSVSGYGFKVYSFNLKSPPSVGLFELKVNASYLKNGVWERENVGGECLINVPVNEGEVSYSAFRVTDFFFNVSYRGKWYLAFWIVNETMWTVERPDPNDVEAYFRYRYSTDNWLIIDSNGKIINDINDYCRIAFAAETAIRGMSLYGDPKDGRGQLQSFGSLFRELAGYAIAAETCRTIGSVASGMVGGLILGYVTPLLTVESMAEALVKGVESGITDPGKLIINMAIGGLQSASSNLYEAASIIKPVCEEYVKDGYPYAIQGIHVDYDDMIRFYLNERNGFIIGITSMHVLSKIYEEGVSSYLKSIAKSLVESALKGHEAIVYAEQLITSTPELRGFLEEIAKEETYYNIRNATFFDCTKEIATKLLTGKYNIAIIKEKISSAEEVSIIISSNSTLLSNYLLRDDKKIKINLQGQPGTTGVLQIIIPKNLLSESQTEINEILVTMDGKEVPFATTETTRAYILTLNYRHSQHTITIYYVSYPLRIKVTSVLNQPLANAKVSLSGADHLEFNSFTDNNGYAYFQKVPPGNFTINIEYKGLYETQTVNIGKEEEITISIAAIDLFGTPLTTMQIITLATLLIVILAIVLTLIFKRKRRKC